MATNNEKYIKENTCTSHKRYESMVMYALHYALRDVQLESQYCVGEYLLDGYFPALQLAVEIDEEHHQRTRQEDELRQKVIKDKLKCEFFRIDVTNGSIYQQIDELVNLVRSKVISPWEHKIPEGSTGDFTAENLTALEARGTELFAQNFREECVKNDLEVVDCNIRGHLPRGNGYLGFLINLGQLQLSVSITKTHKPKLLVTKRDDALISYLEMSLSEPKKNGEYYVIYDFEGRYEKTEVLNYLLMLKQKVATKNMNDLLAQNNQSTST